MTFKKGDKVLVFGGPEASDGIRTVYARVTSHRNPKKEIYLIRELDSYVYFNHMTRACLDNPINRLLYPEYKPYKQFLVEELPNEKNKKKRKYRVENG